jgi:hypothetical protein
VKQTHYPKKNKKEKDSANPKPVALTKQMRTFSLPSSHLSFQKSTREVMEMGALRTKSSNLLKSSKLHHTYYYNTLLNIARVVQICWVLIKNKHPHHQARSSTTRKRTTTRTNKTKQQEQPTILLTTGRRRRGKKKEKKRSCFASCCLTGSSLVGSLLLTQKILLFNKANNQTNK